MAILLSSMSFRQHASETLEVTITMGTCCALVATLTGLMSIGTAAIFGATMSFIGETGYRLILSQMPPENEHSWQALCVFIIVFIGSCLLTSYLIATAGYIITAKSIVKVVGGGYILAFIWTEKKDEITDCLMGRS